MFSYKVQLSSEHVYVLIYINFETAFLNSAFFSPPSLRMLKMI